ncbi:prostate stem cell antigen-like [Acipenser oxyrinchus oxyrinchus]|uniref:Prostate stem cell antigen-like n=1 Tax=Acipenser oxyrinchus oxyrinchus TaxID=40147 RepID=A0AAD8GEX4_ACIOX|nr:prostate stem cell antigen-like [Acipenser oxyrinchus oxyrinchus]
MKTVLALLLLAFVSSCAVEALSCYTCSASDSNEACNNKTVQNCSSADDTCMTTVITALKVHSITKLCATKSVCDTTAAASNSEGKVTCCNTDLCNVSGSTTATLNVLLLGASAALLFLVSRITA